MKKRILVLCTGNSCRSQMAEGFLRHFARTEAEVFSAGIETHGVNPRAVLMMKEDGIDISGHTSNHVDEYRHIDFDFIITVCDHANEHCPAFPAKGMKFHCAFPDPSRAKGDEDEILESFRQVRDEIKNFCIQFVSDFL